MLFFPLINVGCVWFFFPFFFSFSTTFTSVPLFFFQEEKLLGLLVQHGVWKTLRHPGHRGVEAALPWHSCPDDPETDGHHPAVRLTMPITDVGVGYQMVPPGSREELPEGPGFLPQESCK